MPRLRARLRAFCLLPFVVFTPAYGQLYWDSNGNTAGAGLTPTGTWGSSAFWTSNSDGTIATSAWTAGQTAIFSAGSDAINLFTVTVSNTQTAAGIALEEGSLNLSGGSVSLAASATIETGGNSTLTMASVLTGGTSGTRFTKQGAGTLVLSNNANSFVGGLIIQGGIVSHTGEANSGIGSASSTGVIPAAFVADYIQLSNNAVLRNTRTGTITALAANKGIALGTGGGTWDDPNADSGKDHTYGGIISGSGPFTKTGAGVLALSGSNTYTGATFINGGIIRLTGANRLPDASAITIAAGAQWDLATFAETIGSIAGAGNITGSSSATAILTVGGDNSSTTFSGNIQSTAGGTTSRPVTKVGSGTMTLDGVKWLSTGATTINGGSIRIGNALAGLNNGSPLVLGANGMFDMNEFTATVASLSGSGAIINGGDLTIGNNGSSTLTFSGSYNGTASSRLLTKNGSYPQTLSGSNDFTAFNFNGGRVNFNHNNAVGPGLITVGASADEFVSTAAGIVLSNDIHLATGAEPTIYATMSSSLRLNGTISGPGGLLRGDDGSGILTLAGANTFSGGFKLTSRTVSIGNASAFGTGTVTIGDQFGVLNTISITATTTLTGANAVTNNLAILQNFTLSGESLELTSPITIASGTRTISVSHTSGKMATLSGNVSGGGNLSVSGTGTLRLTGTNNHHTGTTNVLSGTLMVTGPITATSALNVSGTLSGNGKITIAPGGAATFLANGKLSPGPGIADFTLELSGPTATITLSSAITSFAPGLLFDLDEPGTSDRLVTRGAPVHIGDAILNLNEFSFSLGAGFNIGDYMLFDGDTPITGTLGVNITGLLGEYDATLVISEDETDLLLRVVPEPAGTSMLILGCAALASRRRRQSISIR